MPGTSSPPRGDTPPKRWIADPPPFGTSVSRFPDVQKKGSPQYHVAYRDIVQPPRWTSKGWVGIDDYIKSGRGTNPSVLGTSSLVRAPRPVNKQPALQPLMARHANETRLQELLGLQKKKLYSAPGPGSYELTGWQASRSHFRRANDPSLDGPFRLPEHTESTRSKEIAATIRDQVGDSGVGPGHYASEENKDRMCARRAPRPVVGTADRSGSTAHLKSLSVSRSIQRGIDWHVPVVVQPPPAAPVTHAGDAKSAAAGGGGGSPSPGEGGSLDGGGLSSSLRSGLGSTAGGEERPEDAEGYYYPQHGDSAHGSSPPRSTAAFPGQPPAPPSSVLRTMRKEAGRSPGNWNWENLGFNYRNSWTSLHGGAFSQGDRYAKHEGRVHSAPEVIHGGGDRLSHGGHGPVANAEPVIYTILEEPSHISGGAGSADPQPQQQQQQHMLYSMLDYQDLRRRRDAEVAATKALEANSRLDQWMHKSVSVT